MTRYAAFARGINVGKRKATAAQFIAAMNDLGFENPAAFLASGNFVFDTAMPRAKLESALEAALEASLGFASATFVRTGAELRSVAGIGESSGLRPAEGEALHVVFLRKPPVPGVSEAVAAASLPDDVLELHGRELYWLRRGPMMGSTLPKGSWPEDLVGPDSTMRNVNTVNRMLAKFF